MTVFYFIFTLKPSDSEGWSDEKSYPAENKGTQIFDKQKSAGRLIKISYRNLIKSKPMRMNNEHFQASRIK